MLWKSLLWKSLFTDTKIRETSLSGRQDHLFTLISVTCQILPWNCVALRQRSEIWILSCIIATPSSSTILRLYTCAFSKHPFPFSNHSFLSSLHKLRETFVTTHNSEKIITGTQQHTQETTCKGGYLWKWWQYCLKVNNVVFFMGGRSL